jgi:hypothetical protein
LTLDARGVVLCDPQGHEVAAFAAAETHQRFRLPSFWESVKDICIIQDNGAMLGFRPRDEAVREIRAYIDRSLSAQGPEALAALRRRGWLYLLGGIGLLVVWPFVMMVVSGALGEGQRDFRGGRKLLALPLVFGLIGLYRGFKLLRQCARAQQADSDE